MCGRSVALGTRVAIALGIARLLLPVLVHRARAGARASRWLFAGFRRIGRLFDYDAIASATLRNKGYNTKVLVGTTNALGARWDLSGELLGTIAPRSLRVRCEHEDNEYDGQHVQYHRSRPSDLRRRRFRYHLHSLASSR